ncbi:hypothetical protein TRVL_10279 [Trypanosoma vivax]|nr:hypothetical protein TRVL_10279 [Trypanosoma vivax]
MTVTSSRAAAPMYDAWRRRKVGASRGSVETSYNFMTRAIITNAASLTVRVDDGHPFPRHMHAIQYKTKVARPWELLCASLLFDVCAFAFACFRMLIRPNTVAEQSFSTPLDRKC